MSVSKITRNTPQIFDAYQDQAFRAVGIEDGNIPKGAIQGKIYTSELSSGDFYNVDYEADVLSFVPNLTATGQKYNYTITVSYTAELVSGFTTTPGYFGSNLIKENDGFVILWSSGTNHNYIRGFVNRVDNATAIIDPFNPNAYIYTYTLYCTVIEGIPDEVDAAGVLSGNYTFYWKRNLYIDAENYKGSSPPINLSVTYDYQNKDFYYYWEDLNQNSGKHSVARRLSSTPNLSFYQTNGPNINFNGQIRPIIDTGTQEISCIKIENPGKGFNFYRSLIFNGDGEGAKGFASPITIDGELEKRAYYIEEISSVGSITSISQTTAFPSFPATYSNVPSTSSGNGTGATFDVIYDSVGNMMIEVVDAGWGYVSGDVITIAAADVGGPPATDITFTVSKYGPFVKIRHRKTAYAITPTDVSYPTVNGYIYMEGIQNMASSDIYATDTGTYPSIATQIVKLHYANDASIPLFFNTTQAADNLEKLIYAHTGIIFQDIEFGTALNSISAVTGSNAVTIVPANTFLPSYFVGATVDILGFVPGTYITSIEKNRIILSNPSTLTGPKLLKILPRGRNYTNVRVEPRMIKENAKFVLESSWYAYSVANFVNIQEDWNYAVAVAGIYTNDTKYYTEWSEEIYVRPGSR